MYERKKEGWNKHLDFCILDLFMMQLALLLAYAVQYHQLITFKDLNYFRLSLVMIIFSILISYIRDSYHNMVKRGYLVELKETLIHLTSVITFGLVTLVIMKVTEIYSRRVIVMLGVFGLVLMYSARIWWKSVLRKRFAEHGKKRPVLLITSSDVAERVINRLNNHIFRDYNIQGLVLLDQKYKVGQRVSDITVVTEMNSLMGFIKEHVIDEIFVAPSGVCVLSDDVLNKCVEMGITVHISLGRIRENDNRCVSKFGGYTVLSRSLKMASSSQILIKRIMDITGGLVGLFLTGLLALFVIPAIKIRDPGPVFFKQVRIGKNGRTFEIYKFRSMYMDAEERKAELMELNQMKGLMFKMDNDPRILKGIGHFIRKTSIDEFPQFWNVLKGDMSLVGTRPPTLDEYEQYEMHHIKRMSIKPGITGMWQSSGRNSIQDFEDVVKLDAEYIENWSVLLDIKIIFRTVAVVLRRDGAV